MNYTHDLLLSDADLEKRVPQNLSIGGQVIESVFTNEEAITICSGITNIPSAKKVWLRYCRGTSDDADIISAHTYATQSAEKYGVAEMLHLISKPPLPFEFGEVTKIFAEFDLMGKHAKNPMIRLISKDTYECFTLAFYAKKEDGKDETVKDPNVLVLRSKKSRQDVAAITRYGTVIPLVKATIASPIINLIIQFGENPKEMAAYYGFKSGECSYCGRELTDERSRQVGYGKRCAENNGLPWGNRL